MTLHEFLHLLGLPVYDPHTETASDRETQRAQKIAQLTKKVAHGHRALIIRKRRIERLRDAIMFEERRARRLVAHSDSSGTAFLLSLDSELVGRHLARKRQILRKRESRYQLLLQRVTAIKKKLHRLHGKRALVEA